MPKPANRTPFWRTVAPGIRFRHLRDTTPVEGGGEYIHSYGGMTLAYQWQPDTLELRIAHAFCNDADRYTKETGRKIAAGRLLSPATRRTYINVDRGSIRTKLDYDAWLMLSAWASCRDLDPDTTESRTLT